MGKIRRFEIELSNANGVVYAGQEVTGKVIIDLSDPTKIKTIKLKFVGECWVGFDDAQKSSKKHADRQVYFEQLDVLFGNADASLVDGGSELGSGAQELPFVFASPAHLPSSFEHKNGRVRYTAKAYLSRRLKMDWTTKKAFSVVSLVDLNRRPEAFQPAFAEAQRRFSLTDRLLCCTNGGLTIQVKIPRSAFVPGEDLPISAEVANTSTLRVKKVRAYLQQNIIFTAKTGSRFFKGDQEIGTISQGEVKYGQSQFWHNEILRIPPLPPTGLGGCKFINITYLLYFIVEVAGNTENVTLTLPVVIGTIPLRSEAPPAVAPKATSPPRPPPLKMPIGAFGDGGGAGSSAVPSAPPADASPFSFPSAPPYDGPPPAYEECLWMERGNLADGEEAEANGGDATYRPLYPTYALH